MSDNPLDEKLVRVWDRDYNLRGQQFVPWNAGTFTVPADDPLAIELWDRRELGHQITVESTDEMAWWIDRMDRTKDGTLIVTCRPHVDILRDCTVPDWKLIEVWLSAEKRWKSQQPSNAMRDRIAAVLGKHWAGASGYDCKCGWETTPMRALSDDYEKHVADAVIAALLPKREGLWGWIDGTVSTNAQAGNPIKLEIEPGEVIPLSVENALQVGLALLAAVVECEETDD